MRVGLTPDQARLLSYIGEFSERKGHPPTYAEMADAMDLKSKSGIHRLLVGLEERGHVERLPNRARSVVLRGAGLPPELEARISHYCKATNISRRAFDQRAAEGLLRGWA